MPRVRLLTAGVLLTAACHHAAPVAPAKLPTGLPFTVTRAANGTPPTAGQTAVFTQQITGFWKQVNYFQWASWLAHGLDASYDPKMPDYTMWWSQAESDKSGDTITFKHDGTDDNMTIEMSKFMTSLCAGYLGTHDPFMHQLVLGFSKGYSAFVKSMRWGDEAPGEFTWARAPFNHNHSYTTPDGKKVSVNYTPPESLAYDWNAHTVPNNTNPYWGNIWVRNIRSQDDVPHITRIVPWLMRLVQDAPDADVRDAAAEALSYLQGFAQDTVTHGYVMRSKEWGQVFIPAGDLVSYDYYDSLLPNGQCNAKIAFSLIFLGEPLGNDCGNGIQSSFEQVETASHYYNYPIVRYFHISAMANALVNGQNDVAQALIEGFGTRADDMWTDPSQNNPNETSTSQWYADVASTDLAAAASGMALTAREAALIQTEYGGAATLYATWPYWNLWDPSIPDGAYDYIPPSSGPDGTAYPTIQEMAYLLEYCASPWKNPASIDPVDCNVVLNESLWGLPEEG